MKHKISFLIITILFLFGVSVLNAQTNLTGIYIFDSDKSSDSPRLLLDFERQESVYCSYFYKGTGTIGGKWTLENGIIKVILSRGEVSWTLKLRQSGNNLEIIETFSEMNLPDVPHFKTILSIGAVFKKVIRQPTAPDLTPEEIGKRVLKLVKSVRTIKDISPHNIKLQTGIDVTFYSENRNQYGYGGNVVGASDWYYNISAYPYPLKGNKTTDTLRFSFDYQLNEPLNPDTTIISKALHFDSLSKELKQAGFSIPKPYYSNHNRLVGWTFTRNGVSLLVFVKGGWEPNVDNCITSMQVSF